MKSSIIPTIVIVGPTASGKSELAVSLAKKFNSEIISADSRQVYRGLDIGSGKITKEEMQEVPHHILDITNISDIYTASDFKKDAQAAIMDIQARGKGVIICGGTGFYIQALTENLDLPAVPANPELRKELSNKTTSELFALLEKKDARRAAEIDPQNPHRLIRALEIVEALGAVPLKKSIVDPSMIWIGINPEIEKLQERIHARLASRLENGMLAEVQKIHDAGISWERLIDLGLEYKYCALHLQSKLSYDEMTRELEKAIIAYAKRQLTWFRKNTAITWFTDPSDREAITSFIEGKMAS